MTQAGRSAFRDDLPLAEARRRYFAQYGFDEAEYQVRSVRVKLGAMRVELPNVEARKRALPYHDIHHVLTAYAPSDPSARIGSAGWHGEAELAAWEFGVGLSAARYWEVWLVNAYAVFIGLLVCPRKVFRAYLRGCASSTLYGRPLTPALMNERLEVIRARLGLKDPAALPTLTRKLRFAALVTAVSLTVAGFTCLVLVPLAAAQALAAGLRSARKDA
jgi:hypothetical protein